MKGIIVRVHLKQFMVFTDIELKPGRNVNVVIAPNGCGKSSLIAGIMLGLCGKPQDIGRGSHVGDFVKTGFSEAFIEIELSNPDENYIIQRNIVRENNRSSWFLNGTKVAQKQVEDLMLKLHIQVNNLCQVLPQDRVYEFSRMNPQTLLENTEKSVGPEILLKYHNELKEMSKVRMDLDNKLKDRTARMDRELSINRGLEGTVEMMVKKAQFMAKIEFYKQQRAWIMYKEQYTLVQEMKNKLKEARADLSLQEKKVEQLTAGMEALKQNVSKLAADSRNKNEVKQNMEAKLQAALVDADQKKEMLERIEEKFAEAERDEKMRLKELEQLRQHLSKLECDLANYNSVSEEQTKERIQQFTAQILCINQKLTETKHEEEILVDRIENIKHRIRAEQEKKKRLEDRANHRLHLLRKMLPDVYEAILWLRQNSHQFRAKIYEPIMLEIDVKDTSYIKFLEEAIPKRDLQAFTCEDKEDMKKFISEMRQKRNLCVNVLYSGPEHAPSSSYVPKISEEELPQYGFSMFVKNMFTAPETIMKYLCRTSGVYRIPVGTTNIDDKIDDLPSFFNFFFAGSNKYFVRISKYSKERCISISSIHAPKFLSGGVDTSEIVRINESIKKFSEERLGLEAQLSALQEKRQEYERHLGENRDERRRLQAGIGGRDLTERRIKAKREQIANVEAEGVNLDEERTKANSEKNGVISSLCVIDERMQTLIQKLDQGIRDCAEINWKLHESKEHLKKRENDARSTRQAYADQADVVNKLEDQYTKARDEAKHFHTEALKFTNGKTPDESFYNLITDNRETLSRKIQELQAKADFMSDANSNVIREFENRKKLIKELSEEIQQMNGKVCDINKKLLETREKWLPELKDFIEKINYNFGRYFQRLGCAGEVMLTSDDPDNYDQYGIYIKVKFRDGDQLQDLNQYTQSGGERSVATALYMIAMQELTHVPFRCVDEINQGMDPVNERRVFELLVNATEGDDHDTPQYFLLTPKLLPGLTFSHKMTITCIMNGSVQKMGCWNTRKQLESRKCRGQKAKRSKKLTSTESMIEVE